MRAQQAATLEKLKTPAPTPSIKEGEDNSIWRTTYDISNVREPPWALTLCALLLAVVSFPSAAMCCSSCAEPDGESHLL